MQRPGDDPYESAAAAARHLREQLGEHDTLVVLGSGWAPVASALGTQRASLPLAELPGATAPTVPGHEGRLLSVDVAGRPSPVLVAAGRTHLYEGHGAAAVVHTVRAAVMAGCRTVVLTNAAGSLRPEVGIGSAVLISDQLNLTGSDPMVGPPPPEGPSGRFCDLSDLYRASLRAEIRAVVPGLVEGVYAGLRGGSFETPAEIRMLATLGADLVGMSTVLEAIAAHHLGAAVTGISLVTNLAAGLQASIDHREVLDAGQAATGTLVEVVRSVLEVV